MSAVATAIGASAVVGYQSAKEGAEAVEAGARAGAEIEREMSQENLAFLREVEQQTREDFAPWRAAGETALGDIMTGLETGAFEIGQIDLTQDPGYQFRLEEGMKALENTAAARGRLLSDASQRAATRYAQDYASQEYAQAHAREADRVARRFNILSSISQGGQASAAQQAAQTGALAERGSNIMARTAETLGGTERAVGTARAGAYADRAQVLNQAAQNWLTYQRSQLAAKPALTNQPTNVMAGG